MDCVPATTNRGSFRMASNTAACWSSPRIVSLNPKRVSFSNPNASFYALKDTYDATQGSRWAWRSSTNRWNFSLPFSPTSNPCINSWEGIGCIHTNVANGVSCDVFNLTLMSYGLNGTLPASIGNLSALSVMNVAYNYLYGTIPSSILTPAALSALYLDNNRFSGSLPRGTATGCQQLQHYSTGNNKFARTIPTTWTSWVSLVTVDFSTNKLTGSLPPSIGGLTHLQYLNLSVNRSLSYQLQSLGKLQTLAACENKLAGTLPRYLNALTSLRTLVQKSHSCSISQH